MKTEIIANDNSESKKIFFEKIDNTLWVHVDGETYSFAQEERGRKSKGTSSQGGSGVIKAAMPGKIIKLFVQKGDAVKQGDSIIVMEAMKMEYTLKSDIPGTVEKVFCSINDQVALGEVLVKVLGTEKL